MPRRDEQRTCPPQRTREVDQCKLSCFVFRLTRSIELSHLAAKINGARCSRRVESKFDKIVLSVELLGFGRIDDGHAFGRYEMEFFGGKTCAELWIVEIQSVSIVLVIHHDRSNNAVRSGVYIELYSFVGRLFVFGGQAEDDAVFVSTFYFI